MSRYDMVNGCYVWMPTCPRCNTDDYMTVKYDKDTFSYFCTKCERPLTLEELMHGSD